MRTFTYHYILLGILTSAVGILLLPGQALADRDSYRYEEKSHQHPADRHRSGHPRDVHRDRDHRRWHRPPYRSRGYTPRYRDYGRPWYRYPRHYPYPRHHHHYRGDNFWGWLAFTAITLAIIDNLNEQQQREHEQTLRKALEAPVGETIRWKDADASGSVTMTREGVSSEGRYCREYSQKVYIGGESQQVYGTACRNPDGSWEIIN